MIGLSLVNMPSKSRSLSPCGCSRSGCNFMRSTTFTTRIFKLGRRLRRIETAARISSVGTSPAQPMTTSGSLPLSLLAVPDADAFRAMLDRGVHREPLRRRVFSGDHHVHIMHAAQAVIHDREQAVGVWRQIDAHDFGLFVDDVIDEP